MQTTPKADRLLAQLRQMPLCNSDKGLVESRYITMVRSAEMNYKTLQFQYMAINIIISVSGVLISALVGIDQVGWLTAGARTGIFWTVFGLSIALNIANKIGMFLSVNKKYILQKAAMDKLVSEGWLFMSGVGIYEDDDWAVRTRTFMARVETISLKIAASSPDMETDNAGAALLSFGPDQPDASVSSRKSKSSESSSGLLGDDPLDVSADSGSTGSSTSLSRWLTQAESSTGDASSVSTDSSTGASTDSSTGVSPRDSGQSTTGILPFSKGSEYNGGFIENMTSSDPSLGSSGESSDDSPDTVIDVGDASGVPTSTSAVGTSAGASGTTTIAGASG